MQNSKLLKPSMIAFLLIVVALFGCTAPAVYPESPPSPSVVPSPTITLVSTPTLVPSTPTATATDTPTLTLTPTATSTSTPTATATPFPEKTYNNVLFSADFSNGHGVPDSSIQGTRLETIPDPTGSSRGNVIRATIIGDPINQGSYFAYRGHVGLQINIAGEAKLENDVYVSKQFFDDATSGSRWWVDQNLFDDKSIWHVAITTIIGQVTGYPNYMILDFHDGNQQIFTRPVNGAPKFTPDAWHKMGLEIRKEQNANGEDLWMAYLFQDKQLVTYGELPKSFKRDAKGQPVWEANHIGPIYAGAGGSSVERARFGQGGYVLEDNMRILTP